MSDKTGAKDKLQSALNTAGCFVLAGGLLLGLGLAAAIGSGGLAIAAGLTLWLFAVLLAFEQYFNR